MGFFALSHLLDLKDSYKHLTMEIVRARRDALWSGLGIPLPPEDPARAWYYVELDFMVWAKVMYGDAFCKYMTSNYEPVDFLFRLAEKSGVVLMDGGGFGGPPWSIRISLANLDDADYAKIGKYMVESAAEYVEAWKASELVRSGPTAGKGQTVKASAAKKRVAAGKTAAKKAVKTAVKKADTAAKSAKKPAAGK
ncbi:Bifunctional aspartate aminotransferase and L-aspartate beta-decarboxylase [compost metagenome]